MDSITNTSFNIYPLSDHPIGDNETQIPAYLKKKRGLNTLVQGLRGKDLYRDRKCFFRALALKKVEKKMRKKRRKDFQDVKMCELAEYERLPDFSF